MKKELHAIFWPIAAVSVVIGISLGVGIGWLLWRSSGDEAQKPEGTETHALKSPREHARGPQSFHPEKTTFKGSEQTTFEGSAQAAEAAWDQIEATTSTRSENDAELRKLIDSLCNSGRWQEALDLVLKKKGPGAVRESLLSRLFYNIGNGNTYAAAVAAGNLSAEGDRKGANGGMRMAILGYQGTDAINLTPHQLAELKEGEATNIASAWGAQIGLDIMRQTMPGQDQLKKVHAILKILDEASGLKTGEEADALTGARLEFLSGACPIVPDVALTELEKASRAGLPSEEFREASLKLVQVLTREDPEDLVNKLTQSDTLRKDVNLLGTSIAIWVGDDRDAAGRWLDAKLPTFNEAQRNAVAFPMVAYCSRQGDEAIAQEWLAQISDEKLKEMAAQLIGRDKR